MFSNPDRRLLRDLARRITEIAELPIQAQRRELWKQHNSLKDVRPMLLVFPEGGWVELIPFSTLRCEDGLARLFELELRQRIYYHVHFCDDTVIEPEWIVNKAMRSSGWGLESRRQHSDTERGAWTFDPVIFTASDLAKLRMPEIEHDELETEKRLEIAEDLFGDILEIKQRGVAHLSYHLMNEYTALRGLEQVMMDMIEAPGMLHDAMSFLTEGHQHILEQCIEQNLLSANDDSTYNSTGGTGYTDELPRPGYDPDRVRPCDMWASAEAQEMAQVSPRMHSEFILEYEKRLLEPFGLTGYGCCEDLGGKLDAVLEIPHIRRVSISPFADVPRSAEKLGNRAILSWKPQPAQLIGRFDEERIRRYLRDGIEVAHANDCVLEIILKDTATCEHQPARFDRWLEIAREEIERVTR